jgi:spore germination protein GerM
MEHDGEGATSMNASILRPWLIRATILALIMSVAACGSARPSTLPVATPAPTEVAVQSPEATTHVASAAPSAEPTPGKVALKAYFLLFGNIDGPTPLISVNREVDETAGVAAAAMQQLLEGPTDDERAHDLRLGTIGTQIPEGTRLLSIDIERGVATVDLSAEFASGDIDGDDRESWAIRLAQVTFTLTQFPTVDSVMFRVDGNPTKAIEGHEGTPIDRATRDAYADQRPGIFIDQPAWGSAITNPLTVSGMAQTFAVPPEFHAALVDRSTDEIVVQQTVRAPCELGCWQPPGGGPFEFQISIPAGANRGDLLLRVWSVSTDGSLADFLEYPLD